MPPIASSLRRNMNASVDEKSANGRRLASEISVPIRLDSPGDVTQRQTFSVKDHGARSPRPVHHGKMVLGVSPTRCQFKVLDSVVALVPVLMVNNFFRAERPPEKLFHGDAMIVLLDTAHNGCPVFLRTVSSLAVVTALSGTIMRAITGKLPSGTLDCLAAGRAMEGCHGYR